MIYIALGYSLILILLFVLLQLFPRYTVSSKVYRNGIIILIFMFCYVAYRYVPSRSNDLYRYYLLMDRMRNRPWRWGLFSSVYSYEPFSNFLFVCIAKLSKNNAVYQVVGVLLIYGMFFLNIKKVTNFNIKKEENLYIITFLAFILLLYSISGTRNTLSAVFFAYGLFNETDTLSKKSWFFYILSVCTHMGMLPVVLLRLFSYWMPKKRFYFIHFILIFWQWGVETIVNLLYRLNNMYIRRIARKLQLYTNGLGSQDYDDRHIVALLILCIFFVIIYLAESQNANSYTLFMGYLIFMTLGCFVSPVMLERYARVLCACMLPMFIQLKKGNWIIKNLVPYVIVALDVGMLCYQTWGIIHNFGMWFV